MALYGLFHKTKVEKFISSQPDPQETRAALEKFYESSPAMNGVRANSRFIIIERRPFRVMNATDVVWIYPHRLRIRYMGLIPVGSTYSVMFCMKDGKQYAVNTRGAKGSKNLVNFLFERLPATAFGYTDELRDLWNSKADDRMNTFVAVGLAQHANRQNKTK